MSMIAAVEIVSKHSKAGSQAYDSNFWAHETLSELCNSEPKRCRQIIQDIRKTDGSDKIFGRAPNGTHCGCAKPKKDCDQASARQRQNLEIDIRADVLDCNANPHCA
jgi:hypothetical protein